MAEQSQSRCPQERGVAGKGREESRYENRRDEEERGEKRPKTPPFPKEPGKDGAPTGEAQFTQHDQEEIQRKKKESQSSVNGKQPKKIIAEDLDKLLAQT